MSTSTASPAPAAARPAADKRETILAAALRVIARLGLHNAPMSAIAREAGVAAGTVYLYFPSKEAMINALYLEVMEDRNRAVLGAVGAPDEAAPDALWRSWRALAHWDLDHPDASNLILQCQASGILTAETREAEQSTTAEGLAALDAAIERRLLRPASRHVFWALFTGPIFALARMRDAGEIEITEEILRATFEGVARALLPE